jgi:hypothetical protein
MRVRAVGLGFPRSPQRKLLRAGRQRRGLATRSIPSSIACGTHRSHSRPKAIGKVRNPSLAQDLNLLAAYPASCPLGREDCTLAAWYRCMYAPSHGRGA